MKLYRFIKGQVVYDFTPLLGTQIGVYKLTTNL